MVVGIKYHHESDAAGCKDKIMNQSTLNIDDS